MYRDDVDALLARVEALQRDLDAAADDKAKLDALTAELATARAELAALRKELPTEVALVRTPKNALVHTPDEPVDDVPARRRLFPRWWYTIPLGGFTAFAIVFTTGFIANAAASCGGYRSFLVETIESCPRAHELLGDDISPAHLGRACGSTETSGGAGNASWRMPFRGSRARGVLYFDLEMHGGRWQMMRGILEVGDEDVDLVDCHQPTAPAAPPASASSLVDQTVTACMHDDAAACVAAGAMYQSGHDGPADPVKAKGLYRRACELGHTPGCRLAATLDHEGSAR